MVLTLASGGVSVYSLLCQSTNDFSRSFEKIEHCQKEKSSCHSSQAKSCCDENTGEDCCDENFDHEDLNQVVPIVQQIDFLAVDEQSLCSVSTEIIVPTAEPCPLRGPPKLSGREHIVTYQQFLL